MKITITQELSNDDIQKIILEKYPNASFGADEDPTGYHSTGNRSTGDHSTGHCSTGNWSTGNWSTGHQSTGYQSTGDHSTGDWSTGHCSTGNWSTGDHSTGDWSISNFSSGHFSTIDYSGFGAFNKPCSAKHWETISLPQFLYFDLTKWISSDDMSEEEKRNNPTYKTTGGYLKTLDYKEAFMDSWNKADKEDRIKIKDLPNFDPDVFFEISGIRVGDSK